MSIDLSVRIDGPLRLRALFPDIRFVLQQIFGAKPPELALDVMEKGHRHAATSDELCDRSSPGFLLCIKNEPETVGLHSDGEFLMVSIGAQRTGLEFTLGAATAIAVARKSGALIEDPWRFFGDSVETTSEDLLNSLERKRSLVAPGPLHVVADRMFAEQIWTDENSG